MNTLKGIKVTSHSINFSYYRHTKHNWMMEEIIWLRISYAGCVVIQGSIRCWWFLGWNSVEGDLSPCCRLSVFQIFTLDVTFIYPLDGLIWGIGLIPYSNLSIMEIARELSSRDSQSSQSKNKCIQKDTAKYVVYVYRG